MKKLLLFLLFPIALIAQPAHVEVRLVDYNVGSPHCDYFFNDWLCNSTNDAGLNTILSNNGVFYFRSVFGHPYPPYAYKIFAISSANNLQQLTNELSAYSTVVESARLTTAEGFSDALLITLNNAGIGIPTGTSGNIIVTNDPGLNSIFQNFNVFYYTLSFPNYPQYNTSYSLTCDCDAVALKAALDNYSSTIAGTYYAAMGMLDANQFEKPKAVITPNPFSDNFNIETAQIISNYSIIDITGKTVISTSSKAALDNQSSQLSTGIYILNLDFDNGQKANYKLVKK
jgi:hypothetical protein